MKKILSIISFSLLTAGAFAQKYSLSGQAGKEAKKVYFRILNNKKNVDSVLIKNGRFAFKGETADEPFAFLYDDKGNTMTIFAQGDLTVDLANKVVKGNKESQELLKWNNEMETFRTEQMAVYKEAEKYKENMPDSIKLKLMGELGAIEERQATLLRELLQKHKEDRFSAYFLLYYNNLLDKEEVVLLLENSKIYQNEKLLAPLRERAVAWKRQLIGAKYTNFTLADTAGVAHSFNEYLSTGNYVLLDFWASWCGPCIREIPTLKKVYEMYGGRGLEIVSVSLDRAKANWVNAINRNGLNWVHLSDLKYWDSEVAKLYGVNSIPFMLLIDPHGKIVGNNLRGEELVNTLKDLLGDPKSDKAFVHE